MEEGELMAHEESFFIEMSTEGTDPSRLWHDVYRLRCDPNGRISSPSFFFPAGRSILNAGKSIVFLRKLGINSRLESSAEQPKLDFETVCSNELAKQMLPFPEMLSASLDFWIQSKFGPASSILRQHLLTGCGLERHLDSLAYVYFSRDGVLFQEFADHVFQRLDSKRATWNDRFLLTELAQRVFAPHVEPSHIKVQNRSIHGNIRSMKALSHIKIDISLPWPILNIVQRPSLDVYQRVFTLLLQVYRAKYLLRLENAMIRHFGADKTTVNMKQRLTWFADNMQTYLLETVLMPAILRLRDQITNAQDVDTLVEVHEKFITSIETQSLLTKNLKPIFDALISLLDLAVLYSDSRTTYIRSQDEASILDRSKRSRQKGGRQRAEQKNRGDSDSSDDDSEPEAEDSTTSSDQYEERLAKINQQFTQLCNFAIAGLRGVSRAGGESSWEMLAERLEWGLPPS
jgi:gamma-tubulin complex component 5